MTNLTISTHNTSESSFSPKFLIEESNESIAKTDKITTSTITTTIPSMSLLDYSTSTTIESTRTKLNSSLKLNPKTFSNKSSKAKNEEISRHKQTKPLKLISSTNPVKTSTFQTTHPLTFSLSTSAVINDDFDSKSSKSRHRKRIELQNSIQTTINTSSSNKSLLFSANKKCNLKYINSKANYVVFMGVFHCAWMSDMGSNSNNYYITKGYKGSSLTMCQNLDELKSYRCYRMVRCT